MGYYSSESTEMMLKIFSVAKILEKRIGVDLRQGDYSDRIDFWKGNIGRSLERIDKNISSRDDLSVNYKTDYAMVWKDYYSGKFEMLGLLANKKDERDSREAVQVVSDLLSFVYYYRDYNF